MLPRDPQITWVLHSFLISCFRQEVSRLKALQEVTLPVLSWDCVKQVMSKAFAEHFDNEIDLASSRKLGRQESRQSHASEDYFVFTDGHIAIVPAFGRVDYLVYATRHHTFLILRPSMNLVLVQFVLFRYWQKPRPTRTRSIS